MLDRERRSGMDPECTLDIDNSLSRVLEYSPEPEPDLLDSVASMTGAGGGFD